MMFLDHSTDVTQWKSEEFFIPYRSPIDSQTHRYYPDFWYQTKDGKQYIIEVKPKAQTVAPTKKLNKNGRPSRRFLKEVATFGINKRKWEAAQKYATSNGMEFKVWTENELKALV